MSLFTDFIGLAARPRQPSESHQKARVGAPTGPMATRRGDLRSLPLDGEAARACDRIYAAEVASRGKARTTRALDLLIAATACSAGHPVYTRPLKDFQSLRGLVDVIAV